MWHGVPSAAVADAVLATGLSSRVSGDDQGYFGKGVYLTPEAEYAAFYANGQKKPERGKSYTLLLCAVVVANVHVAQSGGQVSGLPFGSTYYQLRPLLQPLFVIWALYVGGLLWRRPPEPKTVIGP